MQYSPMPSLIRLLLPLSFAIKDRELNKTDFFCWVA
jgi:hypothetical protein